MTNNDEFCDYHKYVAEYIYNNARREGKSAALAAAYGSNPCAEIPYHTGGPVKTIRPSGPAIPKLDGMGTGVEPAYNLPYMRNVWGETWDAEDRLVMNEYLNNTIDEFAKEYKGIFMNKPEDNRPHTRQTDLGKRENEVRIQGTGLFGVLRIEDEVATLTIEMPGVPREELEVTRLDNTLRIRVNPKDKRSEFDYTYGEPRIRQLYLNMDEDDLVGNVKLALGILTVEIDLDRDVQSLPIVGE